MKKIKNVFDILKDLTYEQMKVYMALDSLSKKNGYSYITTKSLSKRLNLNEQKVYKSISELIKKGNLFFIDLKEKETNRLLERRFYTNKFNFFKDSRNKDKLIPTMQVINDLKEKAKAEDMEKQAEAKRKLEEIELNNLVDEYWENMDNIMYNELYIKAEEKYAKSVTGTNRLQNDFQVACFERLAPIYMKMLIKEKLALDMGKEIPDLFGTTAPPKTLSEEKKVTETFEEKLQQRWEDFEFYR